MNYGRAQSTYYFLVMVAVCVIANSVDYGPGTFFFAVVYTATAYWAVAMVMSWVR